MDNFDPSAAGMFQNVDPVKTNPFWSGVQAGNFQEQAKPGLDMNRASQMMGLQKQGMENQEFMSPLAVGARQSKLESDTATNKANLETLPWKTKKDIADYQAHLDELPSMSAERKAKARSLAMEYEGKPQSALINTIGNEFEAFQKAPPAKHGEMWKQTIGRWEAQHPGIKVPEQYKEWSPDRLGDMMTIRQSQLYTAAHRQKLGEIQETAKGHEKTSRISAGAHIESARIHERGAKERTQMALDSPKSTDAFNARLLSKASTGSLTEEEAALIPNVVEDSFQKSTEGKALSEALKIGAFEAAKDGGKALEAIQQQLAKARRGFYKNKGMEKYMPRELQGGGATAPTAANPLGLVRPQ